MTAKNTMRIGQKKVRDESQFIVQLTFDVRNYSYIEFVVDPKTAENHEIELKKLQESVTHVPDRLHHTSRSLQQK